MDYKDEKDDQYAGPDKDLITSAKNPGESNTPYWRQDSIDVTVSLPRSIVIKIDMERGDKTRATHAADIILKAFNYTDER